MADICVTWDREDGAQVAPVVKLLTEELPLQLAVAVVPGPGIEPRLIRQAAALVVFLGQQWSVPRNETGMTASFQDVAVALEANVRVLPVLVGDIPMPERLPKVVDQIRNLQFARLRPDRTQDADNLLGAVLATVPGSREDLGDKFHGGLLERRIPAERLRSLNAIYVRPSSHGPLLHGLRNQRVQVLVGEPGMGLRTSALMCLGATATHVRELLADPDEALTRLDGTPFTPGCGYLLEANPSSYVGNLERLGAVLINSEAYLVIVGLDPDIADRLPGQFVTRQTVPDPIAVLDQHLRVLTEENRNVRRQALEYAGLDEVQSTLEGRWPDDVANVAEEIVWAIRDGRTPDLAIDDLRWNLELPTAAPDPRLARDYWTTDDTLGHAQYADAITAFIRHRDTRPPLTIGLSGAWGAGKTSLMRMVQERLDPPEDRNRWTQPEIRLSEDSRDKLRDGGPRRRRITVGELLRRAWRRGTADDTDPRDLDVAAPASAPGTGWRPTVWFNPWMYQNGEQVWAGLAHEIISQVTGRMAAADRERFWLRLNLRRIDRQAVRRKVYQVLLERLLPLGIGLVVGVLVLGATLLMSWLIPAWRDALHYVAGVLAPTGTLGAIGYAAVRSWRFLRQDAATQFHSLVAEPSLPVMARKFVADQAKDGLDRLVPDPGYRGRLGFLHLVQTDMRQVLDLVATPDRPLVVFVDDLDRCSSGTVAQVIEAINLFLAGEFPNCVFVLAVEPAVVAAHIEATYKDLAENLQREGRPDRDATLGWRFMEKIVQLPLSLPPPGKTAGGEDSYLDSLLGPAPTEPEPVAAEPTTPVRRPVAEPAPEPLEPEPRYEQASWNERVAAVEAAIRRRSPTIANLTEMSQQAQQEVFDTRFAAPRAETMEAANRVFADLYSDTGARAPIAAALNAAGIRNPREIKRFINLYRFYTFIGQQATLHGNPPVDPAVVAKIVTLALRWPHLLNALRTALGQLEERAGADETPDQGWADGLLTCALAETGDLRRFLTEGPKIASAARVLI